MKVLITGGAGFIGSHLSRFFIERGDKVTVIDNLITGNKRNVSDLADNSCFTFIKADVTGFDFSKLSAFEQVYHLASPASPLQYKKYPLETLMVNSMGTSKVLEFVKKIGGRFILASTSEVYGDPKVHPQIETYYGNVNSFGPRSCYDEGKRFAEAITYTYIHEFGVDGRVARIFNTYGPKMEVNDGRVVSNFINQALLKQPITIYGNGKQTRSFCYVSDLVRGLVALGDTDSITGEVINLGNPIEKTVMDLAHLIIKFTQSSSHLVYKEVGADDPTKRRPDISKAARLLHWKPTVSLEDGLLKTIRYFRGVL